MRKAEGQLLLEILVAVTVLGLVAVAVVNVSTRSIKSSRVANNKKEALDLAKQVLVNVEKTKKSDTAGFFNRTVLEEDCSSAGYDCLTTYDFEGTDDKLRVEVLVTWEEGRVNLNKVFTRVRL